MIAPLEGASHTDAWRIFGLGIGQADVIAFGLIAGTLLIVIYRMLTRGKRYDRG